MSTPLPSGPHLALLIPKAPAGDDDDEGLWRLAEEEEEEEEDDNENKLE